MLIYRPTYIFFCFASTGLLQPDIFVRPLQEVLVHCRLVRCDLVHCRLKLFFLRMSFPDLKGDVFPCVGRLKRVLFACSEKEGCRQYRPSHSCTSCIYRLLACMAVLFSRIFHVTVWSVWFSFSFQMCSLSDVADDLWLSLKLDVCWSYRVLNSFSVIPI